MRQMLDHSGPTEHIALRVIDAFDDAFSDGADLTALAQVAAGLTGHQVGVRDEWNDRSVVVGQGDDPDDGAAVVHAAVVQGVRGRDARIIETDDGQVLVASVEIAAGRVGICWLSNPNRGEQYLPIDYLVAERLAKTVSQRALQQRSEREATTRIEQGAIERLLDTVPGELAVAEIARIARLPIDLDYLVVAIAESPANSLSMTALAAEITRRFSDGPARIVRAMALRRSVAVLTAPFGRLPATIQAAAAHYATLGITITAGIGEPAALGEVSRSWRQAREALALHSVAARGRAEVCFAELGPLQLLTRITDEQLLESALYRRILDALPDAKTPSNLELLEVFLDEASLRKTAAKVFLHHTSVESRLRKIETLLDVDLSDPRTKFELQLLLKSARVVKYTSAGL